MKEGGVMIKVDLSQYNTGFLSYFFSVDIKDAKSWQRRGEIPESKKHRLSQFLSNAHQSKIERLSFAKKRFLNRRPRGPVEKIDVSFEKYSLPFLAKHFRKSKQTIIRWRAVRKIPKKYKKLYKGLDLK